MEQVKTQSEERRFKDENGEEEPQTEFTKIRAMVKEYAAETNRLYVARSSLNSYEANLKTKIQVLNHRVQVLFDRGQTIMPQKMKSTLCKVDLESENSEEDKVQSFKSFLSQEILKVTNLTKMVKQYSNLLRDVIKDKENQLELSTQLQIYCSIQNIKELNKIESIELINNQIIVAKQAGQDLFDVIQITNDETILKKIFTLDTCPSFVVLDEDRVIVDNIVFSKSSEVIQILKQQIFSCAQLSPGLIIVGGETQGKLLLFKWIDSEYVIQQCHPLFTTSNYKWLNFTRIDKDEIDQRENSDVVEFIAQSLSCSSLILYKISIANKDLKTAQKLRLSPRVENYYQVDDNYFIVLESTMVEVLDFKTGLQVQVINLKNGPRFIGLPYEFHVDNLPIGLGYNYNSNRIEVVDLLRKGHKGASSRIDESRFKIIRQLRNKNEIQNFEKQVQVLVLSENDQNLKILNISIEI